ncbi:hypothetical protein FGO68_gene7099 [Halteria grandinella]|uniref:Uncharacterized protein n=1 Tax=Halteria grandinella TaxID=5974 RepID=A0A8J8P4G8_HALGN|nr:hypothetical protein FGO68_gene7099 [Halteria grandinella]
MDLSLRLNGCIDIVLALSAEFAEGGEEVTQEEHEVDGYLEAAEENERVADLFSEPIALFLSGDIIRFFHADQCYQVKRGYVYVELIKELKEIHFVSFKGQYLQQVDQGAKARLIVDDNLQGWIIFKEHHTQGKEQSPQHHHNIVDQSSPSLGNIKALIQRSVSLIDLRM